ncbi:MULTISPECIES: hypothetical protein [unclassified Lysinibacillus]|uniref:hypothetical protein n=1 Tax=unclassified Lysinibacillus TaxID=2636778 RepID=UPI0037FC48E1
MYSFFIFLLNFYNIDWVSTDQDESECSTLLPTRFVSQDVNKLRKIGSQSAQNIGESSHYALRND